MFARFLCGFGIVEAISLVVFMFCIHGAQPDPNQPLPES